MNTINGDLDGKTGSLDNHNKAENHETIDDLDISNFLDLAVKLGFLETGEMKEIRLNIIDLMKKGENFISEYTKYEDLAKDEIDKSKKEMWLLDLVQANILKDGGYCGFEDVYEDKIYNTLDFLKNLESKELYEIVKQMK
ncbi:MAG TPA: hypothetical protein VJ892_04770 [Candidatus Absconditabacterales bacterium]|nr:hypothetical protein [Candidatus Absconditabacterales bacterium]